ncbi:hypothetical protein E2C01_010470 [Portunus trituberculatus]|uniref:Uncharacterized protein n=1 Tax=Portunus trituberculatus TaxID=210409 RepID=A0A5B7D8Q7_PORTR|nr:hypothetical protein [Portunus trituberculatus]
MSPGSRVVRHAATKFEFKSTSVHSVVRGHPTAISNTVSEQDNGSGREGEARALFTTVCVAIQLPDIFTTNKFLVLMVMRDECQ